MHILSILGTDSDLTPTAPSRNLCVSVMVYLITTFFRFATGNTGYPKDIGIT